MAKLAPPDNAGDAESADALARAYDAHAAGLFAVARRLLGVQADAEECVQEVFVRLVEREGGASAIEDLPAYLFASVRHAVSARAKEKSRRAALHLLAAPSEEPRVAGPDDNPAAEIERALRELPPEQRELISLKIDGELTFAEIARVLDISLNTAASRYRYALAKLKISLGAEQNEGGAR